MELAWAVLIIGVVAAGVWIYEHSITRPCPRCGRKVGKGHLTCAWCGYEFT